MDSIALTLIEKFRNGYDFIALLHTCFGFTVIHTTFFDPETTDLMRKTLSSNQLLFKKTFSSIQGLLLLLVFPAMYLDRNIAIYLAFSAIGLYIFTALADELYIKGVSQSFKTIMKEFYISVFVRFIFALGLVYFSNA